MNNWTICAKCKETVPTIYRVDGAKSINDWWCAGCLLESLRVQLAEAQRWINDLQSGMYINCVYCGHRYGPDPGTPVAMADVLKAHIEKCPKHPMSALKQHLAESIAAIKAVRELQLYDVSIEKRLDNFPWGFNEGVKKAASCTDEFWQKWYKEGKE